MKIASLLLLVSVFLSCKSVSNHNKKLSILHSTSQLKADIDFAYTKLKKNHPRLYQYINKEDLDAKFDSLKKTITSPMTSQVFFERIAPVISEVRQGHISIGPPHKQFKRKDIKRLKKTPLGFYKLEFEHLDDKLWLKNSRGKDSALIGSEILKIDGEPTHTLFNKYKKWQSSDGYNTTFYNRFIAKRFSAFYYKDKGFLDSLTITYKLKDSLFSKSYKRLEEKVKKSKDSTLPLDTVSKKQLAKKSKKLSKEERKKIRLRLRKKRKDNSKYGYIPSTRTYNRQLDFIGKDSLIAYMKIRSFSKGNFKKFYKESFFKIDSAKAKHLVLDLRDNLGGLVSEINYLYGYLTDKEYSFIKPSEVTTPFPLLKHTFSKRKPLFPKIATSIASPYIIANSLLRTRKIEGKLYYRSKNTKTRNPKPLNFKGKLYVITNGNSFSASSTLSAHLKATQRALFIGEETGGAFNGAVAGYYKTILLPHSVIYINMGLMQMETPYINSPEGFGVTPHVEIIPTPQDRDNNIDPELEWILNTINNN